MTDSFARQESSARPLTHIAMFLHGFEMGGAQRRTLMLAGTLAASGVRVDLVVVDGEGPLREELSTQINLVDVGGLPKRLPWVRTSRSRRLTAAIPGVAAYLRQERPQVFLAAANHALLAAILAHRMAREPGIGLALRVSNALIGGRSGVLPAARRQLLKGLLGRTDLVLTVAEQLSKEVLTLCPRLYDRTHVVPNPVVDASLTTRAAAPPPHPWLTDGGAPVILGVGRLVPQKDFPTLIRAFDRLRKERSCRLLILGEGPERRFLEELVKQNGLDGLVAMPGFTPNPISAMAHAAAFALSSRWEGMPGALIEAMACGCPVVSTDCPGGSRDVLRNGALGPLVPVADDAQLATALAQALDAPTDKRALIARAHDFDVDAAAAAYRDHLAEAARRAALRSLIRPGA